MILQDMWEHLTLHKLLISDTTLTIQTPLLCLHNGIQSLQDVNYMLGHQNMLCTLATQQAV